MILVTGATGFIGSHFVRRVAKSADVRALVRREGTALPAGVEVAVGDVTDAASLGAAMEGVDVLVHAAAITGNLKEPYPGAYDRVNRVGTENLVTAAKQAGVRRLVVLSGLGTRSAPAGTYLATRWALEEAVVNGGIPFVILQPSVLFGAGSEFVRALASLVRTSPVVPVLGSGELMFQPLWIDDLVTCLERACIDDALLGRAIPLGGSEQLSFRAVIQVITGALGKHRLIVPVPLAIAGLQARLLSAVLPRPPLTPAALEMFAFDNVTVLDAVDRSFKFHPRGFREYVEANGLDA
jgi:NADH dehydrogenase